MSIRKSIDRLDRALEELQEKFNPNHGGDGKFSTGGGSGGSGGSSGEYERYRDRIEGTQEEADNEVKKCHAKTEKIRDQLKTAQAKLDSFNKGTVQKLQDRLQEVQARKASLEQAAVASSNRIAELKARLAAMKKRKGGVEDTLSLLKKEIIKLSVISSRMDALLSDIDAITKELAKS